MQRFLSQICAGLTGSKLRRRANFTIQWTAVRKWGKAGPFRRILRRMPGDCKAWFHSIPSTESNLFLWTPAAILAVSCLVFAKICWLHSFCHSALGSRLTIDVFAEEKRRRLTGDPPLSSSSGALLVRLHSALAPVMVFLKKTRGQCCCRYMVGVKPSNFLNTSIKWLVFRKPISPVICETLKLVSRSIRFANCIFCRFT